MESFHLLATSQMGSVTIVDLTRSQAFLLVSHSVRDPNSWAVPYCFPRCCKQLGGKQSAQDMYWCRYGMPTL